MIKISAELLGQVRERRGRGDTLEAIDQWLWQECDVIASPATIRRWCLDIPRVGPKRTGRAGAPPEVKRAALAAMRAAGGKRGAYRGTCRRYGLSTGTLWKWMREA